MASPSASATLQQMESEGYRQVGPYGGTGGAAFSDDLTTVAQLIAVTVKSGGRVDAIQATWRTTDGKQVTGPWHGGEGGNNPRTFVLQEGEFITKVTINSGAKVDRVQFWTNKGAYFDGGGSGGGGDPHDVSGSVYGFFGRSGAAVDALGFFVK
jgi:Jacalin-like lectin domain